MVESSVFPISWVVAGFANRPVLPVMFIIVLVARVAIFWGSLVATCMTLLTFHINMLAFKRESSQAVVKDGRLPALGTMTDTALCAELATVRIGGKVAGLTGRGRILQIRNGAGLEMALGTVRPSMRSR